MGSSWTRLGQVRRSKILTHEKIRPAAAKLAFGHRVCSVAGHKQPVVHREGSGPSRQRSVTAERTGMELVNRNTLRGVLSVAAAVTLLSLAPRESFAQG
jgi:hypothetical protein